MSTTTDMTCTCGDRDEHIVARRRTADHFDVTMWCNGCIAQWTGAPLPGVPIARPRTAEAWHRERAAVVEVCDGGGRRPVRRPGVCGDGGGCGRVAGGARRAAGRG